MKSTAFIFTFLVSLGAILAAGILIYIVYETGSFPDLLNYWFVGAAVLAIIFAMITNPFTSGLFGFKGRYTKTIIMQFILVAAGIGAVYAGIGKNNELVLSRAVASKEQQASTTLETALDYCKAAYGADYETVSGSRSYVNCEGWMVRARSIQDDIDPVKYVLLETWYRIAKLKREGAGTRDSHIAERLQQCEDGDLYACLFISDLYDDGTGVGPNAERSKIIRQYVCESGGSCSGLGE